MAESALLLVAKIGNQLRRQTRPNKDSVVKSLREATAAFAEIEQPSGSNKKDATRKLEAAIEPLKETIVKGLLRHRDKDVRLLVAICATEIMRLMAPEPPFEDKDLRDVFKLLVSVFAELGDTANSLFSRRAKIVEIVAKLKCCVIMLDIESHAQSCFDEHLVQRVVQIFKSNICLPSSTVPKDGRKCQENSTKSNVIKGDIGTGTGHRRKQAFFPGALGSDGNGASKKSEFSLGKEVVSSCDSVATESSLDDQNVRRSTTALMENVNVNRSIDKEHSNHPSKYKFTRESSADILTELLETDSGETLTDESLKERPKQTKRKKASVDTSVTEVLDINVDAVARRTRRQKKLDYV